MAADERPTCAICLRPVEETTVVVVTVTPADAEQDIDPLRPETPVIVVHEDCIRPSLHPEYNL